jgi:2-haloacid dehalogenase
MRVVAFDVNETLLDLSALDPLFEQAFGDAGLRPLWFNQMLQLAFVGAITDRYVDFTTAQRGALSMLAERTDQHLDDATADEIIGAMSRLPPHPEVADALARLTGSGLAVAAFVARPGMVPSPVGPAPDLIGSDLAEIAELILQHDS